MAPQQKSSPHKSDASPKGKPSAYQHLTVSLAWQLAAPHTWAAALTPVIVSYIFCAITYSGHMNLINALLLLVISALMQSAVNVFDDYFDYKRGTDTLDNSSEDAFDAVLVYNHLNPKSVLALGIGYLALAGILGIYLTIITGWMLLVIGVIGAIIVVAYSGGKTPISHLPIGEFVSGFVMGGLIPLACCYVLSGILEPRVLLVALPCMIGIGMILFTNNTCDIDKDAAAQRKTIAVLLRYKKAKLVYHIAVYVWLLSIVILIGVFYPAGSPLVLLMLLTAYPTLRALLNNPLVPQSRDGAMAQITSLNVILSVFYALALGASSLITWM